MELYDENLAGQIQKLSTKIDNVKSDLKSNISENKEDIKERMADLDKYYSEAMEEMSANIEQVRIMARDSVNAKEKELTDLMNK